MYEAEVFKLENDRRGSLNFFKECRKTYIFINELGLHHSHEINLTRMASC